MPIDLENNQKFLDEFNDLKNQFSAKENFIDLKDFGFAVSSNNKLDFCITALIHGNEVIGIEIINLFLRKYLKLNIEHSFSVILCNTKAFLQNKRFIDYDLNRSFLCNKLSNKNYSETLIANSIQNIINKFEKINLIIDLHQTSEPSLEEFFIIPEDPFLIKLAYKVFNNTQIVAFDSKGFSDQGKTLFEYAKTLKIPAFVIELGHKGYNPVLANQIADKLLCLNTHELLDQVNNLKNIEIRYLYISDQIPFPKNAKLIDNLKSIEKLSKDQVLVIDGEGKPVFKCPKDMYLVFPRYHDLTDLDVQLGLLAETRTLSLLSDK